MPRPSLTNAIAATLAGLLCAGLYAPALAQPRIQAQAAQTAPRDLQVQDAVTAHHHDGAAAVSRQGQPRYIVEALGWRALDETGPDWAGSDEITTLMIADHGDAPLIAVPRSAGQVDSGDQRVYASYESCIYPRRVIRNTGASLVLQAAADRWTCTRDGAAGPIAFDIAMWERDSEWRGLFAPPYCFEGGPSSEFEIEDLTRGQCGSDDLIGAAHIAFSSQRLAQLMPNPGDRYTGYVTLGSQRGALWDHGRYRFAYRITRLADAGAASQQRAPLQ